MDQRSPDRDQEWDDAPSADHEHRSSGEWHDHRELDRHRHATIDRHARDRHLDTGDWRNESIQRAEQYENAFLPRRSVRIDIGTAARAHLECARAFLFITS